MSTATEIDLNVTPRTIRVIRTEVEASSNPSARSQWTRYRVFASELDGTPITEVLKTFDALPVGEVEVTQKAYVKDGAVQSYTITPTTKKRANGTDTGLERRVKALETEVAELRSLFTAAIKSVQED
jgi:hypothetical protein